MRICALAMAVLVAGAWYGPAMAQGSLEDRMRQMEERVRYLEQRVAAQDRTIVEKDQQISKLKGLADGWFNSVEVGGLIEVEAFHESGDEVETATGMEVGKVELGAAAEIGDWASAEILLAMDDGVVVDTAVVTLAPEEMPLSLTVGRQVVPFGVYESTLVSTPLTKALGETAGDSVVAGFESGGVTFSGYLFDGENDRSGEARVENFGASVGYTLEREPYSLSFNVSVIDDIGETGEINGVLGDRDEDKVPGGGASLVASMGNFTLIAEYIAALDAFAPTELAFENRDAEPSAWILEGAFSSDIFGMPAIAAVGVQGTNEAEAVELPESRFLVGVSVDVADGVALGLEWRRDENYDGSGVQQATVLLAASF